MSRSELCLVLSIFLGMYSMQHFWDKDAYTASIVSGLVFILIPSYLFRPAIIQPEKPNAI